MGIVIQTSTAGSAFADYYTLDNCQSLRISKNSGVTQFSLPMLETSDDTTNRVNTDKCELLRLSGTEVTLTIQFWVPLSDVITVLALASNRAGGAAKVKISDWTTVDPTVTDVEFVGLFGSVDLSQEGGTTSRMMCTLTFFEGDNVFKNDDI